jgi:hypothetical protein
VALRLGPANRQQALTPGALTKVFRQRIVLRPAG